MQWLCLALYQHEAPLFPAAVDSQQPRFGQLQALRQSFPPRSYAFIIIPAAFIPQWPRSGFTRFMALERSVISLPMSCHSALEHVGCEEQWLFPESFYYLLETQSNDGSWGCVPTLSQIDGILSTAAALISLRRHEAEPLQLHNVSRLHTRIHKAALSLRSQLAEWCVERTTHVGFEVIVPALLEMLGEADMDFPGMVKLERLKTEKLSKFRPALLYGPEKCTILHSLEAFIGGINFDKVAHHKLQGSIMASPSSTAAYLMNVSHWDDEAEAYLRHVIHAKTSSGISGVPSAYPSIYFEYSWVRAPDQRCFTQPIMVEN